MKIDFYDMFSMHTPEDISGERGEIYMTAAVRNKVHEKLSGSSPAVSTKIRHKRKAGRIALTAAAALIVLVSGALAASALGIIDLEKILGGIFVNGFEHLERNVSVPQNVVTTGDDRLSMRVLAIGGTENEAFVSIELKRNDGGVFPQNIYADIQNDINLPEHGAYGGQIKVVDETTAIYSRRLETSTGMSLIGAEYKLTISDIKDIYFIDEIPYERGIILDGEWTISFPLEYNVDYRMVSVNKPFSGADVSSAIITEVVYSSISLDILFDNVYGEIRGSNEVYIVTVKLDNGEEFETDYHYASGSIEDGNPASIRYSFENPVDVDSIESFTVNGIVIPVK